MTPPMPSNQDGQTTCPECGGSGRMECGQMHNPGHWHTCNVCHGSGTVPSEPADSLEQKLRSEISSQMQNAHIAHMLEKEWSPEMNLLVSRLQALIRRRERAAVEAFAERVKERLHALPRHRPTNTSLWNGVQMDTAIAEVDAELPRLNANPKHD